MIYHGGLTTCEPIMGYAILRTQKLKSGQAMRRSLKHAFREQDTPNADPNLTLENTHIGAASVSEALEKFNDRLPEKVRSNAVLAVEYLITASPEDMKGKSRQEQDAYFGDALKWLESKHGKENVVYAGIHRDEITPHMYAYVVPIDERGKLNCRAFLGGAKALNQMQTEFAQKVGQQHGLQRGIEGSKARHTTIQRYYARANAPFEPLPEVKTVLAKLREEPEKPGFFAGKEARATWQKDNEIWQREKAVADQLAEQRRLEIKAQRDAAVATARRYEAQAREAEALKTKVGNLKTINGYYVKRTAEFKDSTAHLSAVVNLFKPEEIERAQERKRRQDAEKARQAELASQKAAMKAELARQNAAIQAELARQKAVEAARRAEITTEFQTRVEGIQKLLQRGGTTHVFAVKSCESLRKAGNDPAKVDWKAVEAQTAHEAIGKYGQTAESVTQAITRHSPGCADPASHQEIRDAVNRAAPRLEARYEQSRKQKQEQERNNTPGLG